MGSFPIRDLQVYVAGPLGPPESWPETVRAAIAVGDGIFAHERIRPFVPHLHAYWDDLFTHSYECWMSAMLGHVTASHAVFRMRGVSAGAEWEVRLAIRRGIPVFSSVGALFYWADQQPNTLGAYA